MLLIIPAIIYSEKKVKLKPVFSIAVFLLLVSQGLLTLTLDSIPGMAITLLVFFAAFNLLEASLPSLISKISPVGAKGTAIGVYSSIQFLGAFTGATAGGFLYEHHGSPALFAFCGTLLALWLVLAITMKAPAAVRTKMYHVQEMETGKANELSRELASLNGVHEALVLASEGVAYLKVDMKGFDEARAFQILEGEE
jgi:MFS family permease